MRFYISIVKINAFDFLKQNRRFLQNNQALPTSCQIQVPLFIDFFKDMVQGVS